MTLMAGGNAASQHTVRYTKLAPDRLKELTWGSAPSPVHCWRDPDRPAWEVGSQLATQFWRAEHCVTLRCGVPSARFHDAVVGVACTGSAETFPFPSICFALSPVRASIHSRSSRL